MGRPGGEAAAARANFATTNWILPMNPERTYGTECTAGMSCFSLNVMICFKPITQEGRGDRKGSGVAATGLTSCCGQQWPLAAHG